MIIIVFILGLLFGSFYNVCIYRLPIGKSVVIPRSRCGSCDHVLSGLDMVPVLSWLFQGGKCRHCGTKFSGRYAFVEMLTGLSFVLVYLQFGYSYLTLIGIVLSSIVIMVTFIDIDHHIILDRFSVITIALAILYHIYFGELSLLNIGLGFLVGGGLFFIIAIIGTMGGGDIKIMSAFGLLLGFPKVIMVIYLSFVLGAVILSPILIRSKIKKVKYTSEVPFGPFICLGAWLTFMYGDAILDIYMKVML